MTNIDIGVRQEILDLIITETKHSQYCNIDELGNGTNSVMDKVLTKG